MKFIIGFLVTIGLLIVVFILIFRGASHNNQTVQTVPKLIDYANSTKVVQLTKEGPVNADQTHDEVRITVSNMETAVEVFKGYNNDLVNSKTYPNNSAAYADFLAALDRAGYTKGDTTKSLADERGACSTGVRYVMGIKDGDKDIQRFWASTCGSKIGTSKGVTDTIVHLFVAQVPDYVSVTSSVRSF